MYVFTSTLPVCFLGCELTSTRPVHTLTEEGITKFIMFVYRKGELMGEPFIDDYISTSEQVYAVIRSLFLICEDRSKPLPSFLLSLIIFLDTGTELLFCTGKPQTDSS